MFPYYFGGLPPSASLLHSWVWGLSDVAWSRPILRPRRDRNLKSNNDFLLLLVIYLIVFFRIYLLGFL